MIDGELADSLLVLLILALRNKADSMPTDRRPGREDYEVLRIGQDEHQREPCDGPAFHRNLVERSSYKLVSKLSHPHAKIIGASRRDRMATGKRRTDFDFAARKISWNRQSSRGVVAVVEYSRSWIVSPEVASAQLCSQYTVVLPPVHSSTRTSPAAPLYLGTDR